MGLIDFFRNDRILICASTAVSWCLLSGCGLGGKKNNNGSNGAGGAIVTACVLSDGQTNTLLGRWSSTPIKVSIHGGGEFNASDIAAVQAAGATWNSFFSASKGLSVFDMGPGGSGYTSTSVQNSPACGSGTIADGTVIYKRPSSWTKSTAAVAVTTTCYTPANNGGLATIYNAIMELNYVNFFTAASGHFPDLQSIVTHELGHLMGLDHSCGPLNRPNQSKSYMACPDYNADPNNPLISTMMFPQVFFDQTGAGEVKRALTENDEGRANCLYGAGAN